MNFPECSDSYTRLVYLMIIQPIAPFGFWLLFRVNEFLFFFFFLFWKVDCNKDPLLAELVLG